MSHKRQRTINIGSHSADGNRRKDNLFAEGEETPLALRTAEPPSPAHTPFGRLSGLGRRLGFPRGIFKPLRYFPGGVAGVF